MKIAQNARILPRNRKNTTANAAGMETRSLPSVVQTAMTRLFRNMIPTGVVLTNPKRQSGLLPLRGGWLFGTQRAFSLAMHLCRSAHRNCSGVSAVTSMMSRIVCYSASEVLEFRNASR